MTDQPPDGYASDPGLAILWSSVPVYDGAQSGRSLAAPAPPGPPPPPPNTAQIFVDLSTLQSAESSMLSTSSTIVDAYNNMDNAVVAEIAGGTFFGQNAQNTEDAYWWSNGGYTPVTATLSDTGLQQMAQQFAARINPAMTQVLRSIADAVETVGVYIALLNNAGQAYSAADIHSFLPPVPPPITGYRWNRDG